MRTLSLLLLSILFCGGVSAQIPEGTYTYTGSYHYHQTLVFSENNKIQYDLWTNACLTNNYKGTGTYRVDKRRIWMTPEILPHPTYHLVTTPGSSRDSVRFYLADNLKNPIIGATVVVKRGSKTIAGVVSDLRGNAHLAKKYIQPGDTIVVSCIALYRIKYQPDVSLDQHITMLQGYDEAAYVTYLSNHDKGYQYKLTPNSIKINFKDASHCGSPDWWVEFKKVNEPQTTTSNNSSR